MLGRVEYRTRLKNKTKAKAIADAVNKAGIHTAEVKKRTTVDDYIMEEIK